MSLFEFQLYNDGTVVKFPNFDLLPGTQRHGQLGVYSVLSLPRQGHRDVFNLLAIRRPTRGEGKPGIEPGSSDPQSSPQFVSSNIPPQQTDLVSGKDCDKCGPMSPIGLAHQKLPLWLNSPTVGQTFFKCHVPHFVVICCFICIVV